MRWQDKFVYIYSSIWKQKPHRQNSYRNRKICDNLIHYHLNANNILHDFMQSSLRIHEKVPSMNSQSLQKVAKVAIDCNLATIYI